MLDRTRSHEFVNGFDTNASSVVVVVICVFVTFLEYLVVLLGEFLLFVWLLKKNLLETLRFLKKKIRAILKV